MSKSIGNLPRVSPVQYKPDQRNLQQALDALIRNINSILADVQQLDTGVTEVTRTVVSISDTLNPTYPAPDAPTNLQATGLFQSVVLSWSGISSEGFAYYEIFRADTDNQANAVRVGTSLISLFSDSVEEGQTYYYWVRAVNQNSPPVAGAFNSAEGTSATTSISPTTLIDALANQIQASELHASLSSRIDQIDAAGTGLLDRVGVVESDLYDPVDGIAVVTTENSDVINDPSTGLATKASQADLDAISTAVNDPATGLEARALQTSLNSLSSTVDGKAEAAALDSLSAQVNDVNTGLNSKASQTDLTNLSATVDGKAEATSVSQLSTTVDGNTSSIQTQQASIDGLEASYVVKTDVNGRVAGYGLYNSGAVSSFEVLANRFSVWDPETDQLAIGTEGTDFFMHGAFIKDATIENAAIKALAVAKLTSGELTAGKWIKGGTYYGAAIRIGTGSFNRTNESGGTTGYAAVIDSNGNAYFENAFVRGNVQATSINGQIVGTGNVLDEAIDTDKIRPNSLTKYATDSVSLTLNDFDNNGAGEDVLTQQITGVDLKSSAAALVSLKLEASSASNIELRRLVIKYEPYESGSQLWSTQTLWQSGLYNDLYWADTPIVIDVKAQLLNCDGADRIDLIFEIVSDETFSGSVSGAVLDVATEIRFV